MKPGASALSAAAALVALAAGTALLQARRGPPSSGLPAAGDPGPRGLAGARRLLEATGAAVTVRRPGAPAPPAGVVVLAAPGATLAARDVAELVGQARAGATVVIALGRTPQPALLGALGLEAVAGEETRPSRGSAPHRLVGDLTLPAGPGALRVVAPGPLAVAGEADAISAASVAIGRGEVLILAGPAPLENAHLLDGDAVSLVTRLGALGPVVLDERFLVAGGAGPDPRRALVALTLQLLLAGAVLVGARARRLGAVRPAPAAGGGRTARAYVASLAELYRRAGAEQELAASTWRALRRRLERRHGVPAALGDPEAALRVARRSGPAADALARGSAALREGGAGVLLRTARAAAEAEAALERRS